MAIGSTNISFSSINTELGNSSTAQLNMNSLGIRSLAGSISGPVASNSQISMFTDLKSTGRGTLSFSENRTGSTIGTLYVKIIPVNSSLTLGTPYTLLTLSGQSATWTSRTVDFFLDVRNEDNLSSFIIAFHYISGSSFTGDLQLDNISISISLGVGVSDTNNSFESNADNFLTNPAQTDTSSVTSAYAIATSIGTSTSAYGSFVRDSGGTPSGGTGATTAAAGSYYIYAETSLSGSGYPSKNFWLFSPRYGLY